MRYRMNRLAASSFAIALLIAAGPASAATILHLSSSATVKVMPDQLDAVLAAEIGADTPIKAQAEVNGMVGRALAEARAVSAVTTSTGSYSVWHIADPHPGWRAQQTISLTATDGPALLALVGTLQADGLSVSSLAWSLREQTEEAAHDKAESMALAGLKARAERAAKLLGMHFAGFRAVWLIPQEGSPPRPMALMAARTVPEPSAVAGEISVTATVTAAATLDEQ
ncbi:MAG: SIMPL domain-containing protein [Acetobacteraceae bacterium]